MVQERQVDLLLVEDDDDLRQTLLEVLEDEGYSVAQSQNGAVALSLLRSGVRPRTILTDLCMPEMNGWELAECVQSDPALQHISLLVLSALEDADCTETLPPGTGQIRKPVELHRLVKTLRDLETHCIRP